MPIRKKLLALLLAAVLVCTMSLTAFAREAPDTSRKGSIQLTIRQGGTAVPGGSFTSCKAGRTVSAVEYVAPPSRASA